jgi:hydroxymethylpyrimidine/phosphomethylpyrimidine kinase
MSAQQNKFDVLINSLDVEELKILAGGFLHLQEELNNPEQETVYYDYKIPSYKIGALTQKELVQVLLDQIKNQIDVKK